jgi:hypothetical protein
MQAMRLRITFFNLRPCFLPPSFWNGPRFQKDFESLEVGDNFLSRRFCAILSNNSAIRQRIIRQNFLAPDCFAVAHYSRYLSWSI